MPKLTVWQATTEDIQHPSRTFPRSASPSLSYRCPPKPLLSSLSSYSGTPYQANQQRPSLSLSSVSFVKRTSSSASCKQPFSPLAGCDGRRNIFNLSSSNLNAGDGGGPVHGGHSVVVSSANFSGINTGVDGSLSKGRHFSLQAASSSLLESYVNGSDSPLRNLYCQCKHHAAE